MLEQTYYDKADEIIAEHGSQQAALIPIIQDIQAEYRYLPPELLSYVAEKLGINEAKAYSVATFYENFSFEPKGKYIIKVCDGTACHLFRFWKDCTVNWVFLRKKRPRMICCLRWRQFPVWEPAGLRRFLR